MAARGLASAAGKPMLFTDAEAAQLRAAGVILLPG
jgi:hypothetical protein